MLLLITAFASAGCSGSNNEAAQQPALTSVTQDVKLDTSENGEKEVSQTKDGVSNAKVANRSSSVASTQLDSPVTSVGYRNVQFGMTAVQAKAAFDGTLQEPENFANPDFYTEEDKWCYYLTPETESPGVFFMVVNGIVQRVDIDASDISTDLGARIGMNFTQVEALYPKFQRKPNFYNYPTQDLIVQLSDKTKAVFEQDRDEIIRTYRVGVMPAIEFVEGCQ